MHPTSDVSAVHFEPTESQDTPRQRQKVVQNEDLREQSQNWRGKDKVPDKYFSHRDHFFEMFTEML